MKYIKYLAILLSLLIIAGCPKSAAQSSYFLPQSNKDMFKVVVKIMNLEENSGGTGSILSSSESGSVVLTNAHVCRLIAHGGIVDPPSHVKSLVQAYKIYSDHDLCLIKIAANLGINLKIANSPAELGDEAIVAGHPALSPLTISKGHISEHMVITLEDGERSCTDAEKADPVMGFFCALFGNKLPNVIQREGVFVTATIMGGSSGSPVFSKDGEIIAVIFAGQQGLSYGIAVPLESIQDFMQQSKHMPWVQAK